MTRRKKKADSAPRTTHGQLAPKPTFYLTDSGVLFTDGTPADLADQVGRCGAAPGAVIDPVQIRGAAVVGGGVARLTGRALDWARRAGAVSVGAHPDDASLAELLIVARVCR